MAGCKERAAEKTQMPSCRGSTAKETHNASRKGGGPAELRKHAWEAAKGAQLKRHAWSSCKGRAAEKHRMARVCKGHAAEETAQCKLRELREHALLVAWLMEAALALLLKRHLLLVSGVGSRGPPHIASWPAPSQRLLAWQPYAPYSPSSLLAGGWHQSHRAHLATCITVFFVQGGLGMRT